jgi:hypothetical protein
MRKIVLLLLLLPEQKHEINWAKVVMNNLHNRLRDISSPSRNTKDGGPIEFGFAQVLNIVLGCWFLMDEVQHTEMDFEKTFDKDVLSKGKINAPTRSDFAATPSSPHLQLVLAQI